MELYRTLAKTYTTQLDFHNQFKPFRKIGQGLTSTVYEVNRLVDNKRLAVKAFKKSHYFASSGGKGYVLICLQSTPFSNSSRSSRNAPIRQSVDLRGSTKQTTPSTLCNNITKSHSASYC